MNLEILEVINSNKPEEEVVRLQANADVNLRDYAVIDRTFGPSERVTNEFRHIFPFPSQAVKKGEYVRLHTGTGNYVKTNNSDGTVTHHFYWGSKTCIWNDKGGDVATLLSYTVMNSKTVPPVKK